MLYSHKIPELPDIFNILDDTLTEMGLTGLCNNKRNSASYLTPDRKRMNIQFAYSHKIDNAQENNFNIKITLTNLNGQEILNTYEAISIPEKDIPDMLENGIESVIPETYIF